jgi:spore germination protein YaaH
MVAVALVAGGATASVSSTPTAIGHHRIPTSTRFPVTGNEVQATAAPKTANLPAASAAPAPAPPSLAGSPPLQSHEIFGYAPYWTLPESPGFDVKNLTTLAYFSVDANGNGTLAQSGPGWNGYESQDLANLVTRAHAAGDRVVLTVTCFSQSALDQITSDPSAPTQLSESLIAAVSAKNLDGVNFDFEGQGSADRTGLTALITQVSHALHAANPHWQVTMATYASAAADPAGFYDVAALAPALDGFFVMAYDMNDPVTPSATAPLVGGGYNDTEALQQYTAVMPASKVILGVPYYGYDWPTTDGAQTAQSTGPESPVSYGVIAAAGNPTYWDPATETAWTSYQVGSQWHETYFDDPTSLALKAQLANAFHIRGLGIWALGMDGNDPAMLAALLGNAPAIKDYAPGPTSTSSSSSSTSTTVPPGTGYFSTGVWSGQTVDLNPISSQTGGTFIGTLEGFQTSDPNMTCLESGTPLDVWSVPTLPGMDVATAVQPGNCATGTWGFFPSSGGGGGGSSTTTTVPTSSTTTVPSTTTTSPPSTTTTTTSAPSSSTTTTSGGNLEAPSSIPGLVGTG